MARELQAHYYRDNFCALLQTVQSQYDDLLTAAERAFLQRFESLSFDAQCLYIRLVSRVGPWFREGALAYPELESISTCVDELLDAQMLRGAARLCVADLGQLYTVAELKTAFGAQLAPGWRGSKAALLDAITELEWSDEDYLATAAANDETRMITPLGVDTVATAQLLFFGNRYQSLTDFVLSDLGVARYYGYRLDREQRLFSSRAALDEYLNCAALSDQWRELEGDAELSTMQQLAAAVVALKPEHSSTLGRWYRLCNRLARELERRGAADAALALYSVSNRHPARERRARVLESLQDYPAALAQCEAILDAPWGEEEREAALRIVPRVQRKLTGAKVPRHRDSFTSLELCLVRGADSVEQLAARHLARQWRAVHYVENTLMNALFGLAFWEQIFAPVPGAFNNPYQSVPRDMYQREFAVRREAILAARLRELRSVSIAQELASACRRYRDYQCRWVNWRTLDEGLVARATQLIPADHLLAIWQRMLFDPRENRSGFPDLIALGDKPGQYQMIEVKGPGDALQDSQRRWLRFFQQQGIPATVAWVSWRDE